MHPLGEALPAEPVGKAGTVRWRPADDHHLRRRREERRGAGQRVHAFPAVQVAGVEHNLPIHREAEPPAGLRRGERRCETLQTHTVGRDVYRRHVASTPTGQFAGQAVRDGHHPVQARQQTAQRPAGQAALWEIVCLPDDRPRPARTDDDRPQQRPVARVHQRTVTHRTTRIRRSSQRKARRLDGKRGRIERCPRQGREVNRDELHRIEARQRHECGRAPDAIEGRRVTDVP